MEAGAVLIIVIILIAIMYLALHLVWSGLSLNAPRRSSIERTVYLPKKRLSIVQPILSGDAFLELLLRTNLESLESQSFLWLIYAPSEYSISFYPWNQRRLKKIQTSNFHEYGYISYADHLSRYDLVVHHAGAGVLNHCLRNGIPSVVHPIDFDQFDNAARLVHAGVSIYAEQIADLESAIIRALNDPVLSQKCSGMKHVYENYSAEATITQMIESFFSENQPITIVSL